jgi:adenylate cyclase
VVDPESRLDGTVSETYWRSMLTGRNPIQQRRRLFGPLLFSHLPSAPRCKGCTRPFGGPGGALMRVMGHGPWTKNAKYCDGCFRFLRQNHGGAEVECSLLFADVRGSTPLAETMRPLAFSQLMGRFYDTAMEVMVKHDAIVDKFAGDEIVAIFVPSMAGADHARVALTAAIELLRRTGHGRTTDPWVPIGVGVNTGEAYVGTIGEGLDTELTAMGDEVNVAARLASAAGPGEILVTDAVIAGARLTGSAFERRSLTLKGKSHPVDVAVVGPTTRPS